MNKSLLEIKKILDVEVYKKNDALELSDVGAADPLKVAKQYKDEYISLICALFAYGNAKLIEKFLLTLDFSLLDDEDKIERELNNKYYRFQSIQDVKEIFKTISRVKKESSLEELFLNEYKKDNDVMMGIGAVVKKIYEVNSYKSKGYEFFFGKAPTSKIASPFKRYHMFLRWMVREDNLDMGLWKGVDKSRLLMPLDVHTFNVSKKLGLLQRKSYDFKAVLELTDTLRGFDKDDPIKYDFAIYRLGQSKDIENIIDSIKI